MAYFYNHEALNYAPAPEHGPKAQLTELDIFSHVPTQNEIESVSWEQIFPNQGNLNPTSTSIQFLIKPTIEMISLADSYIVATLSLKKKAADGTLSNPSEEEKVFPCNSVIFNLFKGWLNL